MVLRVTDIRGYTLEVQTLRHLGTKKTQRDFQSNTKTLRDLETP